MSENMVLIMIDECGSEVEVDRYTVGADLDEDYMDLWKEAKIEKAREAYPEARRFYFEDRRNWNAQINAMINGDEFYDPWEDEEDEEEVDEYTTNCLCDSVGICAGHDCPHYYGCQV